MLDSLRPAGYIVVFLLVALWIYFRLRTSGKKQGRHGRDLWYSRLEDRRRERVEGAATWEERKRRLTAAAPERKIAARFVEEAQGSGERAKPNSEAAAPDSPQREG